MMTKALVCETCTRTLAGVAVAVLVASLAQGEARADSLAADEHFKRGVKLARDGELAQALEQFELAHALSPHYAVLYNIGQAHLLAGRHLEAATAFERYLHEGGSAIPGPRRAQVDAALERCNGKIGIVKLSVEPRDATVAIDGVDVTPGTRQVRLAAGIHTYLATAPGHVTHAARFEVPAGSVTAVHVDLPRIPVTPAPAFVMPVCDVPGVLIAVGSRPTVTTPVAQPLLIAPGEHVVRFSRSGYMARDKPLRSAPGERVSVPCDLTVSRDLSASSGARLVVAASETDAEVLVDRTRFTGQTLPSGVHEIEVRRAGFEPWSRSLMLARGRTTVAHVDLQPSREYERAYRSRAERQQLVAVLGLGTGLVLGAVSAGLYWHNHDEFQAWKVDRAELDADILDGDVGTAEVRESRHLSDRAADIRAVDDLALATAVTAGALALASVALWLLGPDPDRYAKEARSRNELVTTWKF